jgi:hypothetical protein
MRIFLLVSFAVTTALASTTAFAQDGDSQRRFRQNVRNNESPSFQSNGGFKRGFAPIVKRNQLAPGPSRPPRPSITAQFQKPVETAPRKNFTPVKPAPRIFSTPFPKTADAGAIPSQPSRPPKRIEFAPPKQVEPKPKASASVGQPPSRQIEVSEQFPSLAPPPPKPAPVPVNIQSAPPPKAAQAPIPVEVQAAPAPKPVAEPAPALTVPVQQAELTPPPQAEGAQAAPAPEAAPALAAPPPAATSEDATGSTAEEAANPPQVEAPAAVAPKPVQTVPTKRKKKIVRYYEDDYAAYDEYDSYGSGYGNASDDYGYGGGYSSGYGYGDGGSCD